jgi:hypothetical protein
MQVYKFNNLENGDILLEKIIINLNDYFIDNKKDGNILLSKNINIYNIDDIKKYEFKNSKIIECFLNDIKYKNKLKYRAILEYIYKQINCGSHIIKNTLLNIKTIKKLNEGYYYIEDLGISVQGVESNKCLNEILHQCIFNNIKIKLKIKTIDDYFITAFH